MKDKMYNCKTTTEYMRLAFSVLNYIYLVCMLTVYMLIIDKRYTNITITRYNCFLYITLAYIICMALTAVVGILSMYADGNKGQLKASIKITFNPPSVAMLAFVLANLIACIMGSPFEETLTDGSTSMHAFWGDMGRHMGFATYFLIGIAFVMLARRYNGYNSLYVIFSPVAIFTMVLALVQHTGYDAFGLKYRIVKKQYKRFISTFGNVNIFASYIVMLFGITLGIYMYSRYLKGGIKIYLRVVYGLMLVMLGMAAMVAISDSVYLGIAAICYVAFIIAYRQDELKSMLEGTAFFALGHLIMCVWHTRMEKYPYYKGLSHTLDNVKYAVIFLSLVCLVYLAIICIEVYRRKTGKASFDKNKGTVCILALTALAMIVIVVWGVRSGNPLFKIDYKWGTYRGYIWTKCVETFKEAPLMNKLFGFGNESIRQAVTNPNYDEMLKVTKMIYDNAHNEFLQYLITLGIFGAASYAAFIVTAFVYMVKHGGRSLHVYTAVFAMVGYVAQSTINVNQPITTPIFFFLVAMGVGYASHERRKQAEPAAEKI